MGHAGNQPQHDQNAGRHAQHAGRHEQLLHDLAAHVVLFADARHHHGGGYGNQQARNLGNQRITDGQQDVAVGGFLGRETVLQHADGETTHDVDQQNQDTGHGIAAHELRGTVHGAEEVGFFSHLSTAAFGFFLVNQASIQVSVHSHLFAWHRIQGEAG